MKTIAEPPKTAYNTGEVDQPPVPIYTVKPIYPFQARRKEITGQVTVRLLIDANGRVVRAEIISSEPAGVFDDSALSAVRKWRFKPGRLDGRAVSIWVTVPIIFKLS